MNKNNDYFEVASHNGHITEDAHNYTCGGTYQYNGILSKKEQRLYPRHENTYLKFIFLKDVECEKCKNIKNDLLNSKNI